MWISAHPHTHLRTHTHTPLHNKIWPTECSTVGPQHTLTDPITGQRSHDRPILPQYSAGASPTHHAPSSHRGPHSLSLPSSHPLCSAVISHLLSSKWPLTALPFPPFVRLHHKRVCQSQPCCFLCIYLAARTANMISSESMKLVSFFVLLFGHSIPF